jgi:deoxyribodipyrimidine photolyase-related protein
VSHKDTIFNIIFPHQLFEKSALMNNHCSTYLVEEYLFFKQFLFHKQKIAYHRASMKSYQNYLTVNGCEVTYIDSTAMLSDVRKLIAHLNELGCIEINYINTCDDWLEKRIKKQAHKFKIKINRHQSPSFLNTQSDLSAFFNSTKKKFFQTTFYKQQRIKLGLLIDENNQPTGGKWTYDTENRKKYPKGKQVPLIKHPSTDEFYKEAVIYVDENFNDNLGTLSEHPLYPYDFKSAKKWLETFLLERFVEFGPYEDAILQTESILNHSVISPMLNNGLLTPADVIKSITEHSQKHSVLINSQEGLIRQIIGWREFIRGVYLVKGTEERNHNFWGFNQKIPLSFYTGTTGVTPFDDSIKKVLKTGYCHHIERLMILGNFMLLCECAPNAIYRWFMELFIDAYDWVMVPNVYGMSQFADGGLMSTKPYISGSNYIIKMSNYKKGDWCDIWDALFWRFMNKQRDFFLKNPRLGMLVKTFDKMPIEKQQKLINTAENYLLKLHKNT